MRTLLLILLLPSMAMGLTVDTDHALYSNMKGIYVFEGADGSGSNLVGDGTMVGTVEDADGFDTPITQTHQTWYNDFGSGYTVCIWHDGFTLASWNPTFHIDDSTLTWQRDSSNDRMRATHVSTRADLYNYNMADIAGAQMLTQGWDTATVYAYADTALIDSGALANAPGAGSAISELLIGGTCTVRRVYIFDKWIGTDAIAALQADPNSIFTTAEPPAEPEPPAKATAPSPADDATDVDLDSLLTWTADGETYDVWFAAGEIPSLVASDWQYSYFDPTLSYGTSYAWRIDVNDANGTTTGDVWTFSTEAEPATPEPPQQPAQPVTGWQRSPVWNKTPQWQKSPPVWEVFTR